MNKRSETSRSLQPLTSELIFIIPFVLISAHVFVGFRQEENYLELFLKKGYWPAFGFTVLISSLTLIYVKYMSRQIERATRLDKWGKLFAQVVFCVLGTVLLAFACSTLYFGLHGIHISDTVYFDSYLLPIVLFILLINLWYTNGWTTIDWTSGQQKELAGDKLKTLHGEIVQQELAQYAEENDIILVSISNGAHFARNLAGEIVYWNYNIRESIKQLPANEYFKAGRSQIVHRKVIEQIEKDVVTHQLTLILKAPLSTRISIPTTYFEAFTNWWYYGSSPDAWASEER
jgi:hypothetical protein